MGRGDPSEAEILLEIALEKPAVGAGLAAALAIAGAAAYWYDPKAMYGMARLVAIVVWAFAAIAACGSAVGFGRQQVQKRTRARRLESQRSIEDLHALTPLQFEETIADLYRRQGFRVEEAGGPGDGGVDLVLRRLDASPVEHLVQCKRYRRPKVGAAEVRDFYGAMAARRTRCEGLLVTCGRFTAEARAFAAGKPLRRIDGGDLLSMLAAANPAAPAVATFTRPVPPALASGAAPVFPDCGVPMVTRTARRGRFSGQRFWGCVNYPRCQRKAPGSL